MVYYNFLVFFYLRRLFQTSFNIILYVAKITKSTETEFLYGTSCSRERKKVEIQQFLPSFFPVFSVLLLKFQTSRITKCLLIAWRSCLHLYYVTAWQSRSHFPRCNGTEWSRLFCGSREPLKKIKQVFRQLFLQRN